LEVFDFVRKYTDVSVIGYAFKQNVSVIGYAFKQNVSVIGYANPPVNHASIELAGSLKVL